MTDAQLIEIRNAANANGAFLLRIVADVALGADVSSLTDTEREAMIATVGGLDLTPAACRHICAMWAAEA